MRCVLHAGAATHCNTLQHTATHLYALLHTANHCYALLHTATHDCMRSYRRSIIPYPSGFCYRIGAAVWNLVCATSRHCYALQHTCAATHCNTLVRTAPHCNTLLRLPYRRCSVESRVCFIKSLQHTATYCNTLQHAATYLASCVCYIKAPFMCYFYVLHQVTATHCNTLQHTAPHCNIQGKPGPKRGGVNCCRQRLGSRERTKDVHVVRRVKGLWRRGNEEKDFSKEKGVLRTCHVKSFIPNFASYCNTLPSMCYSKAYSACYIICVNMSHSSL